MNDNSQWDLYVQSTLRNLRNGAQIPEYFGCLIPLLSIDHPPVNFFNQPPYQGNQNDLDDDFISIDVVKPKLPNPGQKQNMNPNNSFNNFDFLGMKQYQQQIDNQNEINHTNVNNEYENQPQSSFSPQQWNQNKTNSPQFNSNSYDSPSNASSQKNNSASISPQQPKRQRKLASDSITDENQDQFQEQDQDQNEFDEFEDEDYGHYAAKFREIGMNMFEKYWYPMKTIVPRMTLESKLMATFKPSKFHRLKKLMTEAKKSTSNKLKFVRAQSDK